MRKKLLLGIAAVVLTGLALTGCSNRGEPTASTGIQAGDMIGVALPAKTSQQWVLIGDDFKTSLADAGFEADVQYAAAANTVADQQNQIQSMITKGAKVIIIGAEDGSQLGTQVAQAKQAGVTVIAIDRNLMNTEDIDYLVTFNPLETGELQAQSLLDGLAELKGGGPYNIELFAGSSTDPNATLFFNGAMSVLQPKIDDGTLVVTSGETSFQQVQTSNWDPKNAQTRMTDLITKAYANGTELDGVLLPNDNLARAVLTATSAAGLPTPVVSGGDSETATIPLIMDGTQYATLFKDASLEVSTTVDLVKALSEGETPETVSDKDNFWNGVKTVPAIPLEPKVVTKENAAEVYKDNPTLLTLVEAGS